MNEIKNNYRYVIEDRLGTLQVNPLGESDFTTEYTRQDDEKLDYDKAMPSKFTFINEAFQNLYKLERSIYRCDFIYITVEKLCTIGGAETWQTKVKGRISLNSGKWDIAHCKVELELEDDDAYKCIDDNKSEEINLFAEIFTRYQIATQRPGITIEKITCTNTSPVEQCVQAAYWCGTGSPSDGGWNIYSEDFRTSIDGIHDCRRITKWARQKLVIPCAEGSPGSAWKKIIEGCPSGSSTWVKPVTVYDCVYDYPVSGDGQTGYTSDCKILGDTGSVTTLRNGMKMADVLNAFLQKFCPTLTVKSNFLNINPDKGVLLYDSITDTVNSHHYVNVTAGQVIEIGEFASDVGIRTEMFLSFNGNEYRLRGVSYTAPSGGTPGFYAATSYDEIALGLYDNVRIQVYQSASRLNYVTGATNKAANLFLFQKSDVKRPLSTGQASQANTSLEKMLTMLCEAYNLRWRIEDNYLKIEHVSFYSKNVGLDLTQPKYAKYVAGMNQYSYDSEKIPQREEYSWKEATYGDFMGLPIVYSGGCVTKDSKDNIKKHAVDTVTTDVSLCLSNPDPDSKVVTDDGFVLVAAETDGLGNYWILSEDGIMSESKLNNSLAWAQLHRDYHKYYRYLRAGTMNGVSTTFLSVKPLKRGIEINIPICCEDVFNPDDIIITPMGNATVDKATESFKSGSVKLELLYAADENLIINTAPVAVADVATTYLNLPKVIDVLANDSDADTGGQIIGIEIIDEPNHGTIVVNSDLTVTYTPETGYTGDDYFFYRNFDDWHEYSNGVMVAINIYPANQPPVANDDYYQTNMNAPLNIPAPGVFMNDSDDVGFTLDYYDATSVNGAAVAMLPDGSFGYVAPTGYFGDDTFTYRIIDDAGLTSSAVVHIAVKNPDYPTAVNDAYSTMRNNVLSIAAPGLLANDSTNIGTLSAVAGTVATVQGGSVTISSNGSFVYTPPSGFAGTDSFNYTASNGTHTDSATATVNVLPTVYVKLQRLNVNTDSITIHCDGVARNGGSRRLADFLLSFYSNSAGTIPMNVTGLGHQK